MTVSEALVTVLCTPDNTGQQILNFFVSVMNMLLIYLFASGKLEKGHKNITWLYFQNYATL